MTPSTEHPTEPARAGAPSRRERASALAWPVLLLVVICSVVLFFIGDLAFDIERDVPTAHIVVQLAFVALALVGVIGTIIQLRAALARARELQKDLFTTREDAERWRSEAEALAKRVGVAVDAHFSEWGLTIAEKEIALLVLRGLSYKEVASVRGTAERTVRHQALAIYRKAGVAGRAEMAAVFLQDVLAGAPPQRAKAPVEQEQPPAAARPPPTLVG